MTKSADSIDCQCGGHYLKKNRSQHMKTKKHQEYAQLPSVKGVDCDYCNRLMGRPMGTIRSQHCESCDGYTGDDYYERRSRFLALLKLRQGK